MPAAGVLSSTQEGLCVHGIAPPARKNSTLKGKTRVEMA